MFTRVGITETRVNILEQIRLDHLNGECLNEGVVGKCMADYRSQDPSPMLSGVVQNLDVSRHGAMTTRTETGETSETLRWCGGCLPSEAGYRDWCPWQ